MLSKAVYVINGDAKGTVFFEQADECSSVQVASEITGMAKGLHGFHVHKFGDNTKGCVYVEHGAPGDEHRHVGDLGNIKASGNGATRSTFPINKSVNLVPTAFWAVQFFVRTDPDDLGKGGHELSNSTDYAGA